MSESVKFTHADWKAEAVFAFAEVAVAVEVQW